MDAPAIVILVGSVVQAAPAASRVVAALVPRAAAFVADLRGLPTPADDPDLDRLLASID